MYYAETAFMGCYNLHCSLWESSRDKAFRHWGGAMTKLFWLKFLASIGSLIEPKKHIFLSEGANCLDFGVWKNNKLSPLALALAKCVKGATDSLNKFVDALTMRTAWRHDNLIAANDISCHPEGRSPRKDLMQSIRDYVVNAVQKNRYPNNTKDLYARFGAQDDSILTDDSLTVANDSRMIYSSEECYDEVN